MLLLLTCVVIGNLKKIKHLTIVFVVCLYLYMQSVRQAEWLALSDLSAYFTKIKVDQRLQVEN